MRLSSQFALAFVPLVIASSAGTLWQARRSVHEAIVGSVAQRGISRLDEAAGSVKSSLTRDQERDLLPVLTAAVANEGASYAFILDNQGLVVAHTDVLQAGRRSQDPYIASVLNSKEPRSRELRRDSIDILEIYVPVWAREALGSEEYLLSAASVAGERRRLGTLAMGIPLGRALSIERKISGRIAVILSVSAAALFCMALLLIQGVLRPVQRLERATQDIAAGKQAQKVPVPAALELAHLAESFNRMVDVLSETTVSRDFLDRILAGMLDPLIVLDSDHRIRMINGAALEMLGFGEGDLLNQALSATCPSANEWLPRIEKESALQNFEVNFLSKSKSEIPVLLSASRFGDGNDGSSGTIVIAKDMRERKKLEREVIQSAKLSAVGKLASGVAHEINNPLGVILGFTESIVFDMNPNDPLMGPLREIEREANRCKTLVQDLLTFSRVSKGDLQVTDLNKTVEGALSLVTAQARLGKVAVVRQLDPQTPKILASANQIQQIVINLANNALDALGAAGTITIQTSPGERAGKAWALLSVTDTGSGIPGDVLPRIFEPFFTTKPVGKGTGLGLGLVHEIVEKHGGRIDVESRPGHTQFLVWLPAAANDAGA